MFLNKKWVLGVFLIVALSGCATTRPIHYENPVYEKKVEAGDALSQYTWGVEWENKVLALDPENISDDDVQMILSEGPAPRVINIHGGIYPVHLFMISFSEFLMGMGYPEEKIRHPRTGAFSYSCYFDSAKLAGLMAWYYEKEAMPLVVVGHSQGGMQTVKVLHELADTFEKGNLQVWNPIAEKYEDRSSIIDPFSGNERSVHEIVPIGVASSVGAGGMTRFLPNQWSMTKRLRDIPASAENFNGYYILGDILGGDLLGAKGANQYRALGNTNVRNIGLPFGHEHITVPKTNHLPKHEATYDWVNAYRPSEKPEGPKGIKAPTQNIVWGADNWHSIKRNWCLAVQRLIRKKRAS